MDTYSAPGERRGRGELEREISIISRNPVVDGLMKSVSGLIAVLDEHRRVLTVNDTVLEFFGIREAGEVLGLRLGEVIRCVHCHDEPGGCGTTKFCSTCGAAVAIVASLGFDSPVERLCAATVERGDGTVDLCFHVRSVPVRFKGHRFLLLFMQDISNQQLWASLERVFFHDIKNILTGLVGITELMSLEERKEEYVKAIAQLVGRLQKEIEIQSVLSEAKAGSYHLSLRRVPIGRILKEVQTLFSTHPVARGKRLVLPETVPQGEIVTDSSLVLRILTNMVTNAFEATAPAGEVKLWVEEDGDGVSFCVWNREVIPGDVRLRVFQKHFSTKEGAGRGMGTFSMKLFGEEFLRGRVDFTSSEEDGTVFRLRLPGAAVKGE